MVDGIDGNNPNILKLKGQKQNIDTSKLEGLKQTEQNKAFFEQFDTNKDGTLDQTEANNMRAWLKETSGNSKISKREMQKNSKNKAAFEALSRLAKQQEDLEKTKEYTEQNGIVTTHVVKNEDGIKKFDKAKLGDDVDVTIYEDGTQTAKFKDGSYNITDTDGVTRQYNKNGKMTTKVEGDKIFLYSDDGNHITTYNKDGKMLSESEIDGNKETIKEYDSNKMTKREYVNGQLNTITVSHPENGHQIDFVYQTEEDLKNNKPYYKVTDEHNPTLKTVSHFTYEKDGTVKVDTIDSTGSVTTTYQNDKGETIENPHIGAANNDAQTTTYNVKKGDSITQIVKDALKSQGIENPTTEQLTQAKKEFLELNKDIVKTYNGSKSEWKGNKFFHPDDVVKIPKFGKTEKAEETEDAKKPASTTYDKQKEQLDALLKEQMRKDLEAKRTSIQSILGDNYVVEVADGDLVVKDKNGNILPKVTKKVNDSATNDDDVATILKSDKNNNNSIELEEFRTFITEQLKQAGVEISDKNRAKFEEIIKKHFNNIDTIKQDGSLTKDELTKNAPDVIRQLTDELGNM